MVLPEMSLLMYMYMTTGGGERGREGGSIQLHHCHQHLHVCSTQTCPNTDPNSYNLVPTMNTGIQKHHSSSPVKGFRPLSVSGVCRYTSHKHLSP